MYKKILHLTMALHGYPRNRVCCDAVCGIEILGGCGVPYSTAWPKPNKDTGGELSALLGTPEFMRLTLTQEWGFDEFATSVNKCTIRGNKGSWGAQI